MPADVGDRLLGGAQQGDLGTSRGRVRLAVDAQLARDARLGSGRVDDPVQSLGERASLEVTRGQLGDDEPGLGEVLGGRLLEQPQALAQGVTVAAVERRLRGPRQRDNRQKALRERVMDLSREPLPFREHPPGVFGAREVVLRAVESLDDVGPALHLGRKGVDEQADAEREGHGDDGAHNDAEHESVLGGVTATRSSEDAVTTPTVVQAAARRRNRAQVWGNRPNDRK